MHCEPYEDMVHDEPCEEPGYMAIMVFDVAGLKIAS